MVREIEPGAVVRRTWPLAGSGSTRMTGVEVETPAGAVQRLVVRRHADAAPTDAPSPAEREHRLLGVLRSAGAPVPAPLHIGDDGCTVVLEHVEGEVRLAHQDLDGAMHQVADALVAIHRIPAGSGDLGFLPRRDLGRTETAGDPPETGLVDLGHVERALTDGPPAPPPERPVLVHGDFWPGNVLWQGKRLAAVIDWEDAGLGDPVADLARARSEFAWSVGLGAVTSFTDRYRRQLAVDRRTLAWWDLHAVLRVARLCDHDPARLADWAVQETGVVLAPDSIRARLVSLVGGALLSRG